MIEDDDLDFDRHAPWIEPIMGDSAWRQRMWGSIVALHGRYPKALAHLKDGWWEDASHVETLCALVVWRDWIDVAADDPRHELAFHAQLADYGHSLRQEGGRRHQRLDAGGTARQVGIVSPFELHEVSAPAVARPRRRVVLGHSEPRSVHACRACLES